MTRTPSPRDQEEDLSWAQPQALLAAWQYGPGSTPPAAGAETEREAIDRNPAAWCALLSRAVLSGAWQPGALLPVLVPKRSGGRRLLMVPSLAARTVQGALAQWLQQNLDSSLHPAAHAYRPGRGVDSAAQAVQAALDRGQRWVWRGDIAEFFDRVSHHAVWQALQTRHLLGGALERVVRASLRAELRIFPGEAAPRDMPAALAGHCCLARGLPQGSPLSPVLSNLVLQAFDDELSKQDAELVRYADDMALLAANDATLDRAVAAADQLLSALGLALNHAKCARLGPGETFVFLGRPFDTAVAPQASPQDAKETTAGPGAGDPATTDSNAADPQHADAADLAEPLMRTLYLLEDGTHLTRQADALVVQRPGQAELQIPSARLGQVLAFGATNVSSGAVSLCLE
jgi:CRISP-associated protein Cas1